MTRIEEIKERVLHQYHPPMVRDVEDLFKYIKKRDRMKDVNDDLLKAARSLMSQLNVERTDNIVANYYLNEVNSAISAVELIQGDDNEF